MTFSEKRRCEECSRFIAEKRPIFLLCTGDGRIIGPYHAECARVVSERAALNGWRAPIRGDQAEVFGFHRERRGR